ncbi:MAG: arginyltransferase, partial [Pseudomonadota bacterium]
MRHTLPLAPQFYVTAPQPCPYLAGRMERKLFTALQGDNAQKLNDSLSKQGFRRSQNVLYRP